MNLYIAEKPELARAIVTGLGGGSFKQSFYDCGENIVTWCIGHLLSLYDPKDYDAKYSSWNLADFPFYFYPVKYKAVSKTKSQLDAVLSLVKKADVVVHAGDPDAEGQLIVDEVLEFAGFKKNVLRFITNDNNPNMIRKALNNLRPNEEFKQLSNVAKARTIADQLYGYNMTCTYTLLAREKGFQDLLSIGRVQTPILSLIWERQKAFENHTKSKYYLITAALNQYKLSLLLSNHIDLDNGKLTDKHIADNIIGQCKSDVFHVSYKTNEIKDKPHPLCFNMLKLQIEAGKAFKLSPSKVMAITQSLREKHKLITYNGTDCQYLNMAHHEEAPLVLSAVSENLGVDVTQCDTSIVSRTFNDSKVSAHHAMIPTQAKCNMDDLSADELNIYQLIAKYYMAQFFPKYQVYENKLVCDSGKHTFKITESTNFNPGWNVIFSDDGPQKPLFEEFNIGDVVNLSFDMEEKNTKPKPLYTYPTLLSELPRIAKYIKNEKLRNVLIEKDKDKADEHGGIGTARTRDVIIDNLKKRKFITLDKGFLKVTKTGQHLLSLLPDEITSPDLTALWHEQMKMIESGNLEIKNFIDGVYAFIHSHIESINVDAFQFDGHKCPKCDAYLRKIKAKTMFWGCSNYPECRFTAENKRNLPVFL